ncbi:MAG: hypothetical protein ABS92_16245 [Thiobacillus sp. SCN 63-374]|nr:MAG: hypothetical protein ABS92_16245 [Thiobacillus sp. SCN 63-374]
MEGRLAWLLPLGTQSTCLLMARRLLDEARAMNLRKPPLGAFLARGLAFALLWRVLAEGRADAWGLGVAATLASLWLLSPCPAYSLAV